MKQGDKLVFVRRTKLGIMLVGSGVIKAASARGSMGGTVAVWNGGQYEDVLECKAYVVNRPNSCCSFSNVHL